MLGLKLFATGLLVFCVAIAMARINDALNVDEPEWVKVLGGSLLVLGCAGMIVGALVVIWAKWD